ncbi:hypothetical protein [Bacillus pinisoli]|uniref:hypothetical protein n=1 Tax=Bacillus pinisoli TaxID=2901866 RepID=UPI001FF1157E|nr:hypothetical protein [Bacillus pinisoli]
MSIVQSKFGDLLQAYGFSRTKPTFYTRLYDDRIEFIHLHKFRSDSSFRVYSGIRFLFDGLDFVALNGIQANGYKNEYPIHYNFRFHNDIETTTRCANQILLFVENEALPWFTYWRNEDSLLNQQNSPLRVELFSIYKLFQAENQESFLDLISQSKKLLGIKE